MREPARLREWAEGQLQRHSDARIDPGWCRLCAVRFPCDARRGALMVREVQKADDSEYAGARPMRTGEIIQAMASHLPAEPEK